VRGGGARSAVHIGEGCGADSDTGDGPMLIWGFDSRAKIGRIHAPVFFIHGDRDEVIPLRLGPDLFAAAREPKSFRLVPGAGHNDIAETAGASYRQYLHSLYGCLRNSAH
jgi:pimeloyl-ACP methyl ester carboxylesterase